MRLLALLLIFLQCINSTAQESTREYLSKNMAVLDVNDNGDVSSFALLDSVLEKNQVFFTGEMHWTEGNFEIKWKMLQYLYHKAGARVLVLEAPRSFSYLLNRYSALNDSAEYSYIARYASQGAKEEIFFMNIFHFNRNKPERERIILRGIDREYNTFLSITAIEDLLSKQEIPQGLKYETSQLLTEKNREWADSLVKKLEGDQKYREHFKGTYNDLRSILRAIACKDCDPPHFNMKSDKWTVREDLMYNNFVEAIREFEGEKFYAQFGKNHVYLKWPAQKRIMPFQPFAMRMNSWNDSPVRGKVCSIVLEYDKIPRYFAKTDRKELKALSKAQFTLFDLTGPASPFDSVARSYSYLLHINYDNNDELRYNRANDHYGYMKNKHYSVYGLMVGYQQGRYGAAEIGYAVSMREMLKKNYIFSSAAFFEFNPDTDVHSYRLAYYGGSDPFFLGVSPVYTTDYKWSAFFVRPEAGFKKNLWSLTYSYNLRIYNKHIEQVNTHMLSLRMMILLSKF